MASNSGTCSTCHKGKVTYGSKGCDQEFCLPHSSGQLDGLINDHDQFKQTLIEQQQSPRRSALTEQIDQWERTSIEMIRRTAQLCRERIVAHSRTTMDNIGQKLVQLTAELQHSREENEINQIDLQRLTNKLTEMKQELAQPANISLCEDSQALIHKIRVTTSIPDDRQGQPERLFGCCRLRNPASELFLSVRFLESKSRTCKQQFTTVAGGNGHGQQLDQLFFPCGIFVDGRKSILIADSSNHRIVRYEGQAKGGTVIAGGNGQGNRMDQLNGPTDVIVDSRNQSLIIADHDNRRVVRWFDQNGSQPQVLIDMIDCWGLAMDKDDFLYVVDAERHEVRRWREGETQTTVVAGGHGRGRRLNQLCAPRFLFVDDEQSVYVSDWGNQRVMKWRRDATKGVIVAGGNGLGNSGNHLSSPAGVHVDRHGYIYVADWGNARVVRWSERSTGGEIVAGGNGEGQGSNQLSSPNGLSLDGEGNLYVVDCGNHRIQKFDRVVKDKCFV